jgi:mono/diheme cytochrome c family protein
MSAEPVKRRRLKIAGLVLLVVAAVLGLVAWSELFREEPEASFATDAERFLYGSLSAEYDQGIPYWIWMVLPRMFPEHLPGPGGLRSLGIPWEEGRELPVGFSKRVIGFPRVANNCAVCHTASYRTRESENPRFVAAGPNHTANVQGYLRFLAACAADPRFTPGAILDEIGQVYRLSFVQKLLYRFVLIPRTRSALLERREQFAWMERPGWPHWGPGRDDPMNLTKYFMTHLPVDDTVGTADFPSIWWLREGCAKAPCSLSGQALNWDGATPSARSVIIDSALGLGARNDRHFLGKMAWLQNWLSSLPAPKYPLAVDAALAASGKKVFDAACASCHASGEGSRMGTIIDVAEVGTDRERLDTWTQEGATTANRVVAGLGIDRIGLWKTNGYVAVPLDGIWLRAPYLHNGSVPHLRDLLEPPKSRTRVFYRGYDVLDAANVGFVSDGPEARRVGFRFDAAERGNGSEGHDYGTDLSPTDKDALIEYMKTL